MEQTDCETSQSKNGIQSINFILLMRKKEKGNGLPQVTQLNLELHTEPKSSLLFF
jgi:hypothetical protein